MQMCPRCVLCVPIRCSQMSVHWTPYAQHEIVRQKVLTASMHKIVKKDDSREMPEIASKRHSFIGEFFTHSGGVLLALCRSDILRSPAVISVDSESRLTFLPQLRQSPKSSKSRPLSYEIGAICRLLRWSSRSRGTYVDLCPRHSMHGMYFTNKRFHADD